MDPVHRLLEGIIDYAGLFPPTAASMDQAVREYSRQRESGSAWMLAAFVVSAGRLDELASAAADLWVGRAWPLSVLLGADPFTDLDRVDAFVSRYGPAPGRGCASLQALEFRPATPQAIAPVVARAQPAEVFCELPWNEDLRPWLDALGPTGARAKIRCGGVTADLIPPVDRLAGFMRACHDAGVGLKFTAGLHHPVRSEHPLTYEADAPTAMMHGFLNVFVAAALLTAGDCPDPVLVAVLEETDGHAFQIEDSGVTWREHRVDVGTVAAARSGFARSFGSCSFTEPIEDLKQLGLP
jgi:hypothetical protein